MPRPRNPTICVKNLRKWRRGQGPTKGCRAIDEWMNIYLHTNSGQSDRRASQCRVWMSKWVRECESRRSHSPIQGEWPVLFRPLVSSKRRHHFKTRRSWERTKIRSWVLKGSETENDCQQFTRMDWTGIPSTSGSLVIAIKRKPNNEFV
jgi:hypothetical protein